MRSRLWLGIAEPRSPRGAILLRQRLECSCVVRRRRRAGVTTRQCRSHDQNRKQSSQDESQLLGHLAHAQVSPSFLMGHANSSVALKTSRSRKFER